MLNSWLDFARQSDASDLHLLPGSPPVLRIHGHLVPIPHTAPIDPTLLPNLLQAHCSSSQWEEFHLTKNIDFAIRQTLNGHAFRCRANYFWSEGGIGACFRIIPSTIPPIAWTGIPIELLEKIEALRNGLVLICGVTGAGKSTTLATIIQRFHLRGGHRIITIEDPIEYEFTPSSPQSPTDPSISLITQRELGTHVASFADGLKYGLRQDPDLLLVGEIRDTETARMALSASETGHLVLSTLHTRDAKGAVSRFVDLFPSHTQNEVRAQLASVLKLVVCQWLLPSSIEGEKQELALEIMSQSSPIASAIRSGKLESIDNYILTGRADGMIPMQESIKRLVQSGRIQQHTADRFR